MAEETQIEWAHATFNTWTGCHPVSPECAHCYAQAYDKRMLHSPEIHWGKNAPRLFQSDSYWRQPLKWNAKAKKMGERLRVFCASLADVFEDRDDLRPHRQRLWDLIEVTPWLDWLLLTKRPQNISMMVPPEWLLRPRPNVWLGTSVGTKERLHVIDHLRDIPAAVRFLSVEPLLNDLGDFDLTGIKWVIAGGESGPGARPMKADWVRGVRDLCLKNQVKFFFKQYGKLKNNPDQNDATAKENGGSAKGGRMLDGRLWDEIPEPNDDID